MEKILKIIIGIILAILLFMWASSLFKSCGNTDPLDNDTTEVVDPAEEEFDEFDDEFFDENDEENIITVDEIEEPIQDDEIDEPQEIEIVEPQKMEERPVKPPVVEEVKTVTATSSNNDEKYLVLAGSYLIKDNAEKAVRKLMTQGYHNAEVVIFDHSRYHSVVADRSNDYNQALQVSAQLKRKGIDNYVHTKQD